MQQKTAAPACSRRDGTHSSTHHDTHSRVSSKLSVSLNISRAGAWEDFAGAEFVNINKSHGYQKDGKVSKQTVHFLYFLHKQQKIKRKGNLYKKDLQPERVGCNGGTFRLLDSIDMEFLW